MPRNRGFSSRRGASPQERLAGDAVQQMLRTQLGRRALVALVVIVLIGLAAQWTWNHYTRARHPVGPTVRIATWNLRQFSDRRDVDLAAIAKIIDDNHFDVLAIQEVKRDGQEIDQLVRALGTAWTAARLSDATGNHERFAFIYNADHVQPVGGSHFVASTEAIVFDRSPFEQTFRAGQFDFTLITVHLSYTDTSRRAKEANALLRIAQTEAARSGEHDIIVLGDMNEGGAGAAGNLGCFTAAGWEMLNGSPSNLGGNETYDQVLIEPKATREYSGTCTSIPFDQQMFGGDDRRASKLVSDHRPVYADFVTNLPDDD